MSLCSFCDNPIVVMSMVCMAFFVFVSSMKRAFRLMMYQEFSEFEIL